MEIRKNDKNFIVGLSLNYQHDGLTVNSIRGLFPKDTREWLTWIQNGKSLYLNKEKIQTMIDQQQTNLADVEYLDLDSIDNIIRNFENPSLKSTDFTKKEETVKFSKPDEDVRGSYSLQNAVASKHGYDVERVNENAGHELNEAKGVIAEPGKIYQPGDVPKLQPVGWIKKRCISYARQSGIIGEHSTPCLGDGVNVSVGGIRSIANHSGSDIKNNLIAYIPELLKNAVLIQTETNKMSRTHLIAAKVRYGNERFVVGMIIHENAGKFYYNHELVEIENADRYSLPASTSGVGNKSASTINVIQNALMSSGFEKNNPKNLKLSKPDATAKRCSAEENCSGSMFGKEVWKRF